MKETFSYFGRLLKMTRGEVAGVTRGDDGRLAVIARNTMPGEHIEVQVDLVRTIRGLERAEILRPAALEPLAPPAAANRVELAKVLARINATGQDTGTGQKSG